VKLKLDVSIMPKLKTRNAATKCHKKTAGNIFLQRSAAIQHILCGFSQSANAGKMDVVHI